MELGPITKKLLGAPAPVAIDLRTGLYDAFELTYVYGWLKTIRFASPKYRAMARRVKDPGSFGAALVRQALSVGLGCWQVNHPDAVLAADVRRYCIHEVDVRVRLNGVPVED